MESEIENSVDLKELGINLTVAYGTASKDHAITPAKMKKIHVYRDHGIKLPKSRPIDHPSQRGVPNMESTFEWVVTGWQTWGKRKDIFFEHAYKYTQNKQVEQRSNPVSLVYAGFNIVDEFYHIKNPGKGAFKYIDMMKKERPGYRPWFITMSGTPVLESPLDVAAALSIMGDNTWEQSDNPFHAFRPKSIQALARTITKHFDNGTNAADLKAKAIQAMDIFEGILPYVTIRRTGESIWAGESLMILLDLR